MNTEIKLIIVTAIGICANASSVTAADKGENGANRRVTAPSGYGGIAGIFSEPTIKGLRVTKSQLSEPVTTCGFTADTKTMAVDIPQMYLGFRAPFEVDAGVTWSPASATKVGSRMDTTDHPNSRWTMFVRASVLGNCYLDLRTEKFQVVKGSLNNATVGLVVTEGYLGVAVVQNGRKYVHVWPIPASTNLTPGILTPKRVIAMTQQKGVDYSGASMTDARFYNGILYRATVVNGGVVTPTSLSSIKKWSEIGGSANHFGPDQLAPWRWGNSTNFKVPFVIQTHAPYDRVLTNGNQKRPNSAFFSRETVDIFMYPAAKASGAKIRR